MSLGVRLPWESNRVQVRLSLTTIGHLAALSTGTVEAHCLHSRSVSEEIARHRSSLSFRASRSPAPWRASDAACTSCRSKECTTPRDLKNLLRVLREASAETPVPRRAFANAANAESGSVSTSIPARSAPIIRSPARVSASFSVKVRGRADGSSRATAARSARVAVMINADSWITLRSSGCER